MKTPCVYILASRPHGTLYVGVTANINDRIAQHRRGEGSEFVRRYAVTRLVHIEFHDSIEDAIRREKHLKHWRRAWKIQLIERSNPRWEDLVPQSN